MPLARVNRAEDIPTSNPDGPWIFRGRNASSPAPGSGADPWRPKEHADFPLRDDLARPQPRGQGRARRSPVSVIRQGTRVKQPLSGQLGTDSPPEISNGNVRFAPPDYVRACPQPSHPVLASRTRSKSAFQRFAWTCPVRRGHRRRETFGDAFLLIDRGPSGRRWSPPACEVDRPAVAGVSGNRSSDGWFVSRLGIPRLLETEKMSAWPSRRA